MCNSHNILIAAFYIASVPVDHKQALINNIMEWDILHLLQFRSLALCSNGLLKCGNAVTLLKRKHKQSDDH